MQPVCPEWQPTHVVSTPYACSPLEQSLRHPEHQGVPSGQARAHKCQLPVAVRREESTPPVLYLGQSVLVPGQPVLVFMGRCRSSRGLHLSPWQGPLLHSGAPEDQGQVPQQHVCTLQRCRPSRAGGLWRRVQGDHRPAAAVMSQQAGRPGGGRRPCCSRALGGHPRRRARKAQQPRVHLRMQQGPESNPAHAVGQA